MIKICSYCRKTIYGENNGSSEISHGICEPCKDYYLPQFIGLKVDQYLNRFDLPIAIVNSEGRIMIANENAHHMLGKDQNNYGFLGGEFMECAHARLPEGCGNTIHCSSCTIRGAINKALAGEDQINVPAYLTQTNRKIFMHISTHKIENGMIVMMMPNDIPT